MAIIARFSFDVPFGKKADYLKLDEMGPVFNGTTHMMMLGSNNLEVADVILNWVDSNVPPRNGNGKGKK